MSDHESYTILPARNTGLRKKKITKDEDKSWKFLWNSFRLPSSLYGYS